MDIRLNNLKQNFTKIVDIKNENVKTFGTLFDKIKKLKDFYADFIKNNKQNLFMFGLDSFHFQGKLIDIEYDDMFRLFDAIMNRMYCEYYKLCKIIVDYIQKNISDKKVLELTTMNVNFPIYKDLEPFKKYDFDLIQNLHENILVLLNAIYGYLLNKEHELKIHQMKNNIGLNIDNFVYTFQYNNIVVREKIILFITYIEFFHKLHTKYLKRFTTKLQLMFSQITNDIKFEDTAQMNKTRRKSMMETLENDNIDESLMTDLKSSMGNDIVATVSSDDELNFIVDEIPEQMEEIVEEKQQKSIIPLKSQDVVKSEVSSVEKVKSQSDNFFFDKNRDAIVEKINSFFPAIYDLEPNKNNQKGFYRAIESVEDEIVSSDATVCNPSEVSSSDVETKISLLETLELSPLEESAVLEDLGSISEDTVISAKELLVPSEVLIPKVEVSSSISIDSVTIGETSEENSTASPCDESAAVKAGTCLSNELDASLEQTVSEETTSEEVVTTSEEPVISEETSAEEVVTTSEELLAEEVATTSEEAVTTSEEPLEEEPVISQETSAEEEEVITSEEPIAEEVATTSEEPVISVEPVISEETMTEELAPTSETSPSEEVIVIEESLINASTEEAFITTEESRETLQNEETNPCAESSSISEDSSISETLTSLSENPSIPIEPVENSTDETKLSEEANLPEE